MKKILTIASAILLSGCAQLTTFECGTGQYGPRAAIETTELSGNAVELLSSLCQRGTTNEET